MWGLLIYHLWIPYIYAYDGISFSNLRFENDVNMYGIQTLASTLISSVAFENDVNMYGIQTMQEAIDLHRSLRMM